MDSKNPFSVLIGLDEATSTVTTEPTVSAEPIVPTTESTKNLMEQKVNGLIEHIFSITINQTPQKNKQLVFMEELAACNPNKTLINMEIFEQALFERLLLHNPRDYLIPNNTQNDETDDIAGTKALLYLYRSYERLSKWCRNENSSSMNDECEVIRKLIIRNASTAHKQPELYENNMYEDQSLSSQWMTLFHNYMDEYECKCEFLSKVVADVASDTDPNYKESLRNA